MRDRRIAAQFPDRDRRERHQGQIAARPGDPGEPGLPASAEPGRIGGRSAQRRPGHDRDAQHQHGEGRQPGQHGDATDGIAAQTQAGQAGQHLGQAGAGQDARQAGRRAEYHRLGQHRPHHLPRSGATRPQQRGLLLAQAGQQPCGQRQSRPRHQQQLQRGDREQRPGQHDGAGYADQEPRQARGHVQPLGKEHRQLRNRLAGARVERLDVPAGHRRRLRQHHPRGLDHGKRSAELRRVHHRGAVGGGGLLAGEPRVADGGTLDADP